MSGVVVSPSHVDEGEDATSADMGGSSSVPCFCLLDGFFQDPDTDELSRVTIPITKLPATLGRSHDSEDPYFFGLGKKKALSRKQCRISYRDTEGGKVEWDASQEKLTYREPTGKEDHATLTTDEGELPSKGFFVIECLGKNRILVNQKKVEQGHAAVVGPGSSLRVSSYALYFLLPTDNPPAIEHSVSMEPTPPVKKRKLPSAAPDTAPSSSSAAPSTTKKSKASQQDELDSLSAETLLERMTEAINSNLWERRHQLIGAAIALHAVRDSALDPAIQAVAVDGGVSRSEIMVWIEESSKYSEWVKQMLTKMEPRSFQAAITKSLLKAGFTRTGSSGRYIKWILPPDVPISPQVEKSKDKKDDTKEKESSKQSKSEKSPSSIADPVKKDDETGDDNQTKEDEDEGDDADNEEDEDNEEADNNNDDSKDEEEQDQQDDDEDGNEDEEEVEAQSKGDAETDTGDNSNDNEEENDDKDDSAGDGDDAGDNAGSELERSNALLSDKNESGDKGKQDKEMET